jgi:hypothetical protein
MEPLTNHTLSRIRSLISYTVEERLQLDLDGMKVITEAATGPFAVTAAIAAAAGARVEAIAADSAFGSSAEAAEATMAVSETCTVADRVTTVSRETADFHRADVVTNLGFVRPLDRTLVEQLPTGAVIPLMYELEELRPAEIDVDACRRRGIRIVGTNERHPAVDVLRYCGLLAVKMLFELGMEVVRSRVIVVGAELFSGEIRESLATLGAEVTVISRWEELTLEDAGAVDVLFFSDYGGKLRDVSRYKPLLLDRWAGATLIQFTGGLDYGPFIEAGWRVVPEKRIAPFRMWRTLADLGPRPVIELHAGGLKAAELILRGIPESGNSRFAGLWQPLETTTIRG